MNIWITQDQMTAILGTLLWTAEMIEQDAVTVGLEPRLKSFAIRQAAYNRQLIRDLEEQR